MNRTLGSHLKAASLLISGTVIVALFASCFPDSTGEGETERSTHEARSAQSSSEVELVLDLEPGRIWSASLVNHGREPVEVVLPGDGSIVGWRTPIIKWSVVSETGVIRQHSGGRCGNINPLELDEVVTLRSGERVSLVRYGLFTPRLPSSGVVSVSLSYENDPHLEWGGLAMGPHESGAMARVRASTPLSLTSNIVQFEIEAPQGE